MYYQCIFPYCIMKDHIESRLTDDDLDVRTVAEIHKSVLVNGDVLMRVMRRFPMLINVS